LAQLLLDLPYQQNRSASDMQKHALLASTLALVAWNTASAFDSHYHSDHNSDDSWMFSYKYMTMDMHGNRDSTSNVKDADVRNKFGFNVAPTSMWMEMHMFGAMYHADNNWSFMAMVPYVKQSMEHLIIPLSRVFTARTEGLGDIKFFVAKDLSQNKDKILKLKLGISLPTGSVEKQDIIPGGRQRLPYPMQLGSGTYDLIPGIEYSSNQQDWSWGTEFLWTYRTDTNTLNYDLGNRYDWNNWISKPVNNWSFKFSLNLHAWENINGKDDALNAGLVPTADPDRRAGQRADALIGITYDTGSIGSISLEAGKPIYQDLDGPQLETDFIANAAWRISF
jgi:hypothetical protein